MYILPSYTTCNGHGDCEEDSSNDSFQCNCDATYAGTACALRTPGIVCSNDDDCTTGSCETRCCLNNVSSCSSHGACSDTGDHVFVRVVI